MPAPNENPTAYALRAAVSKAQSVSDLHRNALILGADTIVCLGKHIFGKPNDHFEALNFLKQLRGKTHSVITGCALYYEGNITTFFCETRVSFWKCPDELLSRYAMSKEVLDKAGAYAIQGQGAFLVESLSGSWSNVVGLPISELMVTLSENNFLRSIR